MAKYRFEIIIECPDDMRPEDVLDLMQESTGGEILNMSLDDPERLPSSPGLDKVIDRLGISLERCGFKSFGTIHGINENRSCTHFLRNKEHLSIEAAPEEETDVLEALTDGQGKEEEM